MFWKKWEAGFYLSTCVKGVPKGSGLGTSSILAGACVKAFAEFLGENWDDSQIYDTVLNLEQIMSTGGGLAGSGRRPDPRNQIYYIQTRNPPAS